jgi:hemolysin III
MPNDNGPIYVETLMGRFPVEPWNTYSNLLFLALIVFWFLRIRNDARGHRFIALSLPVLVLGFVGGTVFHATRSHNVWLALDIGPIALLVFAVAIFFWRRQGIAWFLAAGFVAGPIVLAGFALSQLDLTHGSGPLWGYSAMVFVMLLPVLRYLSGTGWKNAGLVGGSLAMFALAAWLRSVDGSATVAFLPMGTHWLWHGFGAAAVHLLMLYIYRGDRHETPVSLAAA